jgi:diguanylate cyclase (GGDEF)-like protein
MPRYDALTGLLDAHNLDRRIDSLMARADEAGLSLSLLIMDLGGLRAINDAHGWDAGDIVLKAVGRTLVETMPEPAVCIRLGGDAFVVLLPGTTREYALEGASRLQEAVEQTHVVSRDGARIRLTATTGVSTYPEEAQTPRSLLRTADKRLQVVKAEALAERP